MKCCNDEKIISRELPDSNSYSFRLLAGGGFKIPMGKWRLDENSEPEERAHLPGTGSLDYLISIRLMSQFNRIGLNLNSNYMIATKNMQSYNFANQLNLNANLLYKVDIKSMVLYPNTGIYFESSGFDKKGEKTIVNSGGYIVSSNIGLDINYNNLSMHASFQFPLKQTLNGYQPQFRNKLVAGIVFNFN